MVVRGVLDPLREVEVVVRDPAGVMRRQRHRDLRVSNVDVGVVIHLVGGSRHSIDERDPIREARERICLH